MQTAYNVMYSNWVRFVPPSPEDRYLDYEKTEVALQLALQAAVATDFRDETAASSGQVELQAVLQAACRSGTAADGRQSSRAQMAAAFSAEWASKQLQAAHMCWRPENTGKCSTARPFK